MVLCLLHCAQVRADMIFAGKADKTGGPARKLRKKPNKSKGNTAFETFARLVKIIMRCKNKGQIFVNKCLDIG